MFDLKNPHQSTLDSESNQFCKRERPHFTGCFYSRTFQKLGCSFDKAYHSLARPDIFDENGVWNRVFHYKGHAIFVTVKPNGEVNWVTRYTVNKDCVEGYVREFLVPLKLPKAAMSGLPRNLRQAFVKISPAIHVRSETLWEALMKAVLRQVIGAAHAKRLIHRFVNNFGEKHTYGGQVFFAFPTPQQIMTVEDSDLLKCGVGFKLRTIRGLCAKFMEGFPAEFYKNNRQQQLDELATIKGVGDWTARIALCDFFADWSMYPIGDLAVRHWATTFLTSTKWPDKQCDFEEKWKTVHQKYSGIVAGYLIILYPELTRTLGYRTAIA